MIDLNNQIELEHNPPNQVSKKIGTSFYRGANCNFNPYKADRENLEFCKNFILKGHLPQNKIINKSETITTFGSCFAQHINNYLSNVGFNLNNKSNPNIYISFMGEGLVNVYSILQQFQWALEDKNFNEILWYDKTGNSVDYNDKIKNETKNVFLKTDVFIITLGLSEIWYNAETNNAFWKAIPISEYNDIIHKFKVCSFEETKNAISEIHRLIKTYIPNAKIVFTLSPIPLAATFRNQSSVTANCVSKAILRAALDEYLRNNDAYNKSIFYFPSFELIDYLFPDKYSNDGRHLNQKIINGILQLFETYYCETTLNNIETENKIRDLSRQSQHGWK
jgi:hypothetical protein